MEPQRTSARRWLTAIVLAHFAISIVHGSAHVEAHVPLSVAANVFVFTVILAGPLVGLTWAWVNPRGGSRVVAVSMAGSFVFGVVNHFLLAGPDHVAHGAAPSRVLFATSAVLVAISEAMGCMLALGMARGTIDVR